MPIPYTADAFPGFKFGADPELFVVDLDGEFVSAEGLIPGTKEEPYKVPGGAIQVDGMAAEFNIDPVTSFEEFNGNIMKVMKTLKRMLPDGYDLRCVPTATFSEKVWEETPDIAKILGCTPDFNAWTGSVNPPPNTDATPRLRTASGHVHIGWTEDGDISDKDYVRNCRDLVKQLDYYLGAWSLDVDPDPVRRKLYGKAGAMRFKPYGAEYRVLSNFWLKSAAGRRAVWNRMQKAIFSMRTGFLPEVAGAHFNELVIQSINESKMHPSLAANFHMPILTI